MYVLRSRRGCAGRRTRRCAPRARRADAAARYAGGAGRAARRARRRPPCRPSRSTSAARRRQSLRTAAPSESRSSRGPRRRSSSSASVRCRSTQSARRVLFVGAVAVHAAAARRSRRRASSRWPPRARPTSRGRGRQPVPRRQQPVDGLDVCGARRAGSSRSSRGSFTHPVPRRVRRDAACRASARGVTALADRLARLAVAVQRRDEGGDVGGGELVHRTSAELGSTRSRAVRCCVGVAAATSTRDACQRSATSLSVGACGAAATSRLNCGTRSAASSRSISPARMVARRLVRNEPPCRTFDSRPPSRYCTR